MSETPCLLHDRIFVPHRIAHDIAVLNVASSIFPKPKEDKKNG